MVLARQVLRGGNVCTHVLSCPAMQPMRQYHCASVVFRDGVHVHDGRLSESSEYYNSGAAFRAGHWQYYLGEA